MNARDLLKRAKDAIRMPYAWPGGYPISLVMGDGACLCPECGKKNWRSIYEETRQPGRGTGWKIAAVDVLWEGGNHCDQCGTCLDAYPAEEDADPDE